MRKTESFFCASVTAFFFVPGALALGIGATARLSAMTHLGLEDKCGLGGCAAVLAHPHARPFGVPLAYCGLTAFLLATGLIVFRFP